MHSKLQRLGGIFVAVLAASLALAGPPAHAGNKNQIKSFMLNMGVERNARGSILFVQNKAQSFFMIKLSHATPGATYDVMVNGAIVDQISTNAEGAGRVMHRARVKGRKAGGSLPYDPRGGVVEVAAGGTVILHDEMPTSPDDCEDVAEVDFELTNTGVLPGAAGVARLRERCGRMKFEVEANGLAASTSYDLLVNGTVVATATTGIDNGVDFEFDSRPEVEDGGDGGSSCDGGGDHHDGLFAGDCDDQGEDGDDDGEGQLDHLLTFDPLGATLEIRATGSTDILLTGVFPATL